MSDNLGQSESVVARVSQQLAVLEKRDWQMWLIVAGTGILVGTAFLALLFPAAILHQGSIHLELIVSREAFVGLAALLILFNTYMITRRLELRRMREAVISTSIQNELVRLQSFTDPLTEVYNRRSLDDMAARFMARARRLDNPLTFMVVDADRFKDINTRFGHLTGDFVIAEIAAMLQGAVRGSDAVVRFGGDEFLVILADAALAGALVAANRVEKSVEEWNKGGHLAGFELSLSIGLAEWSPSQTVDQVLIAADQQMYAAKEAHKRASG
ncbi:MAG: GGDEF domain-containing protein [Acidobacteriia bacterium]|nr:GGDEF domain-containing protein [Terriglobia bacterium]